jgi:predicted nucleic acid-binding Zn ribbon protein
MADTAPCPHCRRQIYADAERCPHCGQYLSEEDTPPTATKPLWVVVLAVLLLLVLVWSLWR